MNRVSPKLPSTHNSFHQFLTTVARWFAMVCWGGAYVAARFLLHPATSTFLTLSPLLLATLRFGIASLFFVGPVGYALIHHQISARDLLRLAGLGLFTYTLYFWLQYIGIQQTNASVASILGVGLIPLFTVVLAQVMGTERLRFSLWAAFLLGFGGVVLLVLQQPFSVSFQSGFLLGTLCFIGNTFCFALYTHLSKRWMRDISPTVLTGGTMISGAIGLVVLSLLVPTGNAWKQVAQLDLAQWMVILFLAVVCSVLAYVVYNFALSQMKASRVTLAFYVEPLVAIVLGVVLLGEHLNWQVIVGGAVIGASVWLVTILGE